MDAFSQGVVKSGTDYSIYTNMSLEGINIAFYQQSKYHTQQDSILFLGGKASLWTIIELALLTSKALIKDDRPDYGDPLVYFDCMSSSNLAF